MSVLGAAEVRISLVVLQCTAFYDISIQPTKSCESREFGQDLNILMEATK